MLLPTVPGVAELDTLAVAEVLASKLVMFNIYLQLCASALTVAFGTNPLTPCVVAGLFIVTVGAVESLTATTVLK